MIDEVITNITLVEYEQLPETNQFAELIGGKLIRRPSPTPKHQSVSGEILFRLSDLIPDGELFPALTAAYFDDENIPQPDIIWVAEGSQCVITPKRLEGPPDLIVEVLSPGTAKRDRGEKFDLYERCGVREYWLADPDGRYIEVFVLLEGAFKRQGIYGTGESFASPVLGGKTIDMTAIFGSEEKS